MSDQRTRAGGSAAIVNLGLVLGEMYQGNQPLQVYVGDLGAQGGLAGSSWVVGTVTCPCHGTTCVANETMTLNSDGTTIVQTNDFFCTGGGGSGTWVEQAQGFDETSRYLSVVWLGNQGTQNAVVGTGFRRQ